MNSLHPVYQPLITIMGTSVSVMWLASTIMGLVSTFLIGRRNVWGIVLLLVSYGLGTLFLLPAASPARTLVQAAGLAILLGGCFHWRHRLHGPNPGPRPLRPHRDLLGLIAVVVIALALSPSLSVPFDPIRLVHAAHVGLVVVSLAMLAVYSMSYWPWFLVSLAASAGFQAWYGSWLGVLATIPTMLLAAVGWRRWMRHMREHPWTGKDEIIPDSIFETRR